MNKSLQIAGFILIVCLIAYNIYTGATIQRIGIPPFTIEFGGNGKKTPLRVDLSGQWNSNLGNVYNISMSGNRFNWKVANIHESGSGTVDGGDIQASWNGDRGSGSASGQVTVDSKGKATQIVWNNGIVFFR